MEEPLLPIASPAPDSLIHGVSLTPNLGRVVSQLKLENGQVYVHWQLERRQYVVTMVFFISGALILST